MRGNIAATVALLQLLPVNNSSVIKIVVQVQIRLRNSTRTVALRRATDKFHFILLTNSLDLPGIALIFFDSLAILQ